MRILLLLLRLSLCLGLAANGVAFAHAGVTPHPEQAGAIAVLESGEPSPGCHEAASGASDPSLDGHGSPGTPGKTGAAPCCDGDACACGGPAQGALAAFVSAPASSWWPKLRGHSAHGGASGYPPPRLPHLIRPPIG